MCPLLEYFCLVLLSLTLHIPVTAALVRLDAVIFFFFVSSTRLSLGRDRASCLCIWDLVMLGKLLANEVRNDLCLKSDIISIPNIVPEKEDSF